MVQDDFARLGLAYDDSRIKLNLSTALLVEEAIRRGEGVLSDTGSLCVTTGKYTGRSPRVLLLTLPMCTTKSLGAV